MTLLQELKDSIQTFAEVLNGAIDLEVDVFDTDLNRIAGTGKTKDKVGHKIDVNGIINRFIYKGESRIIIDHPGKEEKCSKCSMYNQCIYHGAVYAQIRYGDELLGAMGILAMNDEQKASLRNNQKEMLELADKIAELIGNKVHDYATNKRLKKEIMGFQDTFTLDEIIGESPIFKRFKEKVKVIAKGQSTVLLIGETGTGKELFSRAIHQLSPRKEGPFVAINCGAIPENLIESELFGYEKGAFTGANNTGKLGKFYIADKGTVFLDELENMPLYMQQKLLRVIENGEIEPLGSQKPKSVDLRIIAASNKNLEKMVEEGLFREDLYHRLNVITLSIPPLRERGQDIIILANHFINRYNTLNYKNIEGLSDDVEELLLTYHWPGNVRELQNVIEYAINMETEHAIRLINIPDRIKVDEISYNLLEQMEKDLIKRTIDKYGWSDEGKSLASKELGISRSTVYRKVRKYNLTEH